MGDLTQAMVDRARLAKERQVRDYYRATSDVAVPRPTDVPPPELTKERQARDYYRRVRDYYRATSDVAVPTPTDVPPPELTREAFERSAIPLADPAEVQAVRDRLAAATAGLSSTADLAKVQAVRDRLAADIAPEYIAEDLYELGLGPGVTPFQRQKPLTFGEVMGNLGVPTGLRSMERVGRGVGLGVGTLVGGGLNRLLDPYDKTFVGRWLPGIEDVPEAFTAFNRMRQEGDWDAGIEAYQEELGGGPGFWGTSELAGAVIPTGGPALAGTKLISAAPKLAGTIARVAPRVVRPGVEAGIRGGLRGTGKVLRAPWEAEEAVGRLAAGAVGAVAGPAVRPLVSRFRRPREVVEEALEEAPVGGLTPEDVAVTDDILLSDEDYAFGAEFPEPWDIRPVYKGPQPGITNVQRRAYQEAVEQRRLEGYPESVPVHPRLAAQEARMAIPISTGKKALTGRIDFEVRMGRLEPEIGALARDWLEMLPDEYLDDLGSSYVNRINLDDFSMPPNMVTGGGYNAGDIIQGRRSPGIITIAKNVVNQSDIGDRTIIHEVAHHLEDFVPSRDARRLVSQWQREMRNKGESLISEVNKIRTEVSEVSYLTEAEKNKIRAVYRYEGGFQEWFAEVLTDKALRDLYMEVPAYRNIIQKVMDQIRIMAVATRDFIARVLGRGDEAERVYKKLISGDYSVAERRTLRSEAWDMAEEAGTLPPAARVTPAPIGNKLFHGTRHPNPESFIDDNGNLVLRASENFEGKTVGVSFSESQETALDYATRIPGTGPARARAQGAVFEIDADAIPSERLFVESDEEIATRGAESVIIPQGKFRIIKDIAARTELEKWEARQIARVKRLSDPELADEWDATIIAGEVGEFNKVLEDPFGRVAPGVSTDIVAKYGPVMPDSFPVWDEILRRVKTSNDPEGTIARMVSGIPDPPRGPVGLSRDILAGDIRQDIAYPSGVMDNPVFKTPDLEARRVLLDRVEEVRGTPIARPTTAAPVTPAARVAGEAAEGAGGVPGGPTGRLAEAGEVPPGLPQLQDMGEAIGIATRSNLGRRLANFPVIRSIMQRVNPSAVRNTVEERGLTGLAILRFEAEKKASESMSALGMLGRQERVFGKVDAQGLFTEGNLRGLAPNDVRTNWEQLHIAQRLNDEQRAWIQAAQKLEEAKLVFLKSNGIEITELTFESGGHYAGRRVMGTFDSEGNLLDWKYAPGKRVKGGKLRQEKERSFRTQQEAIDSGYRYIPEDEALSMNVRAAYNRVADKKFAEWMLANSPSMRVLGKGRKLRTGEVAAGKEMPGSGIIKTAWKGVVFTGPDAERIAQLMRQELTPELQQIDKLLSSAAKVNATGRFMMLNGDASHFLIQLLYMTGARGGLKAWGKGLYGFARTLGDTTYHKALIDNNKELLARHRGLITSLNGNEYTEAMARGGLLSKGPSFKTIFDPSASMRSRMAAIAWAPLRLTGKALDPFSRALSGTMDTAGIELAKSMDMYLLKKNPNRPITAAEYADVDAYINEIRGLHSSARLGQSARWRSIENNLLLAPRYNRSIAALLWDTVADGGIRGHEARRALGFSLTGLTAIAVGFSIIEYLRETEEKDRTEAGWLDAVMKHITPTSPEFFTWKVGNSNVGPGTKVRSLIKLFAQSYDDPRSLLEIGMDNPFTRFARSNLAPIASDAWDIFSGYTYMGDPTGFFDGWDEESVGENFSKLGTEVILPDIMPIWVHAAALEGGTLVERGVRGVAEFFGERAYPLTWTQRAEQIAEEKEYGEYEALPRASKRKAEVDKLVEEEYGKRYGYETGPWRAKVDKANDAFVAKMEKATALWLSRGPTHKDYSPANTREAYRQAEAKHRVLLYGSWDEEKQRSAGGYYDQIYDMDKEQEAPELGTLDHLLWQYRNIIPNATDAEGEIDWEEVEKLSSAFWSSLTRENVDAVLGNIRVIEAELPEEMQTFLDAGRYAQAVRVTIDGQSVSFWDIEDLPAVREAIVRDSGATRAQVDEYMDATFDRQEELRTETEGRGIYGEIHSALTKARKTDTGVLGTKKMDFIREAPMEWLLAMYAASYDVPAEVELGKVLKRLGLYSTQTEQPYASLYRDALVQR